VTVEPRLDDIALCSFLSLMPGQQFITPVDLVTGNFGSNSGIPVFFM
jgi:hypothetical protein